MPAELLLQTLKDLRRGALRLGAGLGLYALFILALYPLARAHLPGWLDNLFGRLVDTPDAASDPSTWLSGAGFLLVFPLFLCIYAIWTGSRLIAGEERDGTLALLLSYPVPRWRLSLEKFSALAVVIVLLGVGLWALLALCLVSLGLAVPLGHLAGACAGLALLALTFGGLAFALSTAGNGPGRSRLIALGALAAAYLLSAFWLHGVGFLRYLSPFYYATGQSFLVDGLPAWHGIVLALLTSACVIAAGVVFEKRDLAV